MHRSPSNRVVAEGDNPSSVFTSRSFLGETENTNYMEQGPCEADSSSVSQQIPFRLWNPNVPKCSSLDFIWTLINPVHSLTHYFFEIHFNIVLIYSPKTPKFLPSDFPAKAGVGL
jgi:hypothetical protein